MSVRFRTPSGERIACGLVRGKTVTEVDRGQVGVCTLKYLSGERTACGLVKGEAVTEVGRGQNGG